ncbi:TetR/AcrR family transcriptional regulator [Shewanella sp. A3A]|uniref:TetR/AcrR family transcriptional regulator n=1 Tax=Shewanella electrica TaxID=515560 RepID=A0ABT2FPU4_9GAMM|nr:TetR/AcrR family transcriptional regulator [Shewanella electrica]MCH1920335.1 TetR/AcrR family transcriptional regulator [Shewanella ferrihydritica]MCH1925891.1 TetR/AcrR family transcriptional regulator [Shewanella electrica]MCS4557224.1 TetR/AcrR family transcriptional regulator [Shewanella electrica]
MKTRDRIIQASLQLFNEHGERSTTTNHIAAHLGMSPGNLYYHFRNKEDIILSIFQQYEQHLESAFQPYNDEPLNIELLIKYFDAIFYALWQFRFIYTNLADILSRDEALKTRYLQVQTRLQNHVCELLTQLCNDGFLQIEPANIPALADTVKMLVSFWISYQLTQSTMKSITKSSIYEGVVRLLMLFRAYATSSSLETITRLEQHYAVLAHD